MILLCFEVGKFDVFFGFYVSETAVSKGVKMSEKVVMVAIVVDFGQKS